MADFGASYSEMERMAAALSEAREDINGQLISLKRMVNTLLGKDFKTQHASGRFGDGYEELTDGLTDALEGIEDMSKALRRMMGAIADLDWYLAGH